MSCNNVGHLILVPSLHCNTSLQGARFLISNLKSKVLPRQAEVAQGVPGSLRSRIFLTFRHYKGGRSSVVRTGRLYHRRNPWYSLPEAESTSGHMVLSGVPREKSPVTPPGIDPGTSRLVTQCLNHYATPPRPYFNSNVQRKKKSIPYQLIQLIFLQSVQEKDSDRSLEQNCSD